MKRFQNLWLGSIAAIYPLLFCLANVSGLPVLHADARKYLETAQLFTQTDWLTFFETAHHYQPPLYSVLWGCLLEFTELPPSLSTTYLHAFFLFLFGYQLLKDYLPKLLFFQIVLWMGLIFSHHLFKVNMEGFAETPYWAAVGCSFCFFHRYKKTAVWYNLLALIFCVMFASMLRYVGLVLILAIFFAFLSEKNTKTAFVFLLSSLCPTALWLIKNYLVFGVGTGGHLVLVGTPLEWEIVPMFVHNVSLWLNPFVFLHQNWLNVSVVLLFFAVLAALLLGNKTVRSCYFQTYRAEVLYTLFYLGMLALIIRPSGYPYPFMRILLPVLPYFSLAFVHLGAYLYAHFFTNKGIKISLLLFYGIWAIYIFRSTCTHLWVRRYGAVDMSLLESLKNFLETIF